MTIVAFIFLLITSTVWAQSRDLCDILDLKNCSGVTRQGRRTSLLSLPSPSASSNINPSTVSFDRGFGIETMHQQGNPVVFNLATGTGKVGGAFISTSLENSFFGNRVVELDDAYLKRRKKKNQYENKKLSLAFGGRLIGTNLLSLDLGIIFKRHSEIKKINTGVGLSGRVGPIHFGGSVYKDDFYLKLKDHNQPETGIPYTVIFDADTYQESFAVTTLSAGVKISKLSLDAGVIKTKYKLYDSGSEVHLYSGSLVLSNFMFNVAMRNEINPAPKFINRKLVEEGIKSDYFGGVQYSIGKHLVVGVNYNYFLLDEYSFIGTVFF